MPLCCLPHLGPNGDEILKSLTAVPAFRMWHPDHTKLRHPARRAAAVPAALLCSGKYNLIHSLLLYLFFQYFFPYLPSVFLYDLLCYLTKPFLPLFCHFVSPTYMDALPCTLPQRLWALPPQLLLLLQLLYSFSPVSFRNGFFSL